MTEIFNNVTGFNLKYPNYNVKRRQNVQNGEWIEFEKKSKHSNYIFSNGIDFIYEFFNLERKVKSKILSKTVKFIGKNSHLNSFL